MPSLNKVYLMGNLTRDPELRRTQSGTAVASLGLAVNREYRTKDGEIRKEVLFADIAVWDRQAESCAEHLGKGSSVHIEGSLKLEQWDDKSTGEKRQKLAVHADRVTFLDGKPDDGGQGGNATERGSWGGNAGSSRDEPHRGRTEPPGGRGSSGGNDRPPGSGRALFAWAMRQKDEGRPDILKKINEWGKSNRLPERMTEWPNTAATAAYEEVMGAG